MKQRYFGKGLATAFALTLIVGEAWGQMYEPKGEAAGWLIRQKVSAISDVVECRYVNKENPNLTIADRTLFLSTVGRRPIVFALVRFGKEPAEEWNLRTEEQKSGVIAVRELHLARSIKAQKLVVQINSNNGAVDEIVVDTAQLEEVQNIAKSMGCPANFL